MGGKKRELKSSKNPQFLVALLLFSATEGKRTLRGNARTAADNRDAVIIIILYNISQRTTVMR